MKELKKTLLTTKYTKVFVEEEFKDNAPRHYAVVTAEKFNDGEDDYYDGLCEIKFQEGPIKECGVNGAMDEDLINIVIDRLEHFQNSEFKCRENDMAITKLEEALMWLRKRTQDRENRGVQGTHNV